VGSFKEFDSESLDIVYYNIRLFIFLMRCLYRYGGSYIISFTQLCSYFLVLLSVYCYIVFPVYKVSNCVEDIGNVRKGICF